MDTIEPMLAVSERSGPTLETLVGTHGFDLKLDGVRALLYWDGKAVRLMNRNSVDITNRYPDVVSQFPQLAGPLILDGEIVARDNSFESIAIRDRQTNARSVAAAAAKMPAFFIAFDVLRVASSEDMTRRPWIDRRNVLTALGQLHGFDTTPWTKDAALFKLCRQKGLEGVIAKRLTSTYQPGRRSADWVKFKCTHRVSCVPVGYETGTGSRSRFGAMHLAMVGPTGPVMVGRVGTGFTEREIDELKARLDRGELFVVEIETLNVTKGGQLRFPVYKGIRADLSPTEATIDQLSKLPTC